MSDVNPGPAAPCEITVLICTYNPDPVFLDRCLRALREQTFPRDRWELLLIDNCSSQPVERRFDISWHPRGRHLTATPAGKTHAIKAGLREASAELLLIVDDDNILASDYLETAHRLLTTHTFIGVVGGSIAPEFEQAPPPWAKRYFQLLAITNLGDRLLYCCSPDKTYVPPGAGMAIRRSVVDYYLQEISNDPTRQGFDPVGDKLSRAGDTDMALCAWDLNLAKGYFPELRLTHLIPAKRLEVSYLTDLFENTAYCDTMLQLIRGMIPSRAKSSFADRVLDRLRRWFSIRGLTPEQIRIDDAGRRGTLRAHRTFVNRN